MERSRIMLLGERLIERGLITPQQLDQALNEQKNTNQPLGVILLKNGFIQDETVFLSLLAEHIGLEYVRLNENPIPPECIAKFPAQFAAYYRVMPFRLEDDRLILAACGPLDQTALDGIRLIWPGRISVVLASEKDVAWAIREYYGVGAETIDAMMGVRGGVSSSSGAAVDDITELDSEASIGKFLNQILLEAYQKRATDIHIEPFESDLKIRYRIDGVLLDVQVPKNIWHFRDAIGSRVKIMSNLNIAERRLPQDGRFKVRVGNVDLDLRVSVLPTPNGESIVLRLLSSAKLYDLAELGLNTGQLKTVHELLRRPHGIIFVTGPTGSGKTTTLYCCLSQVADVDKKIITIEDPIEYLIRGVTQIQVNPKIHFTFANGLRSMLRHDPDIMMVGEVRDLETAQIAIQVALTGHLVFSTLHTNDAVGAVTRLLDMGIEPYLVASSVEAFIAQRLVRRICPYCRKPLRMTADSLRELGFSVEEERVVYEGAGCQACDFSGYFGREGIFECLVLNDTIRDLIVQKSSAVKLKNAALNMGMQSLLQDGWSKITRGVTTVSEVVRVTKDDSVSQE